MDLKADRHPQGDPDEASFRLENESRPTKPARVAAVATKRILILADHPADAEKLAHELLSREATLAPSADLRRPAALKEDEMKVKEICT
jgi:hypothetical protein